MLRWLPGGQWAVEMYEIQWTPSNKLNLEFSIRRILKRYDLLFFPTVKLNQKTQKDANIHQRRSPVISVSNELTTTFESESQVTLGN